MLFPKFSDYVKIDYDITYYAAPIKLLCRIIDSSRATQEEKITAAWGLCRVLLDNHEADVNTEDTDYQRAVNWISSVLISSITGTPTVKVQAPQLVENLPAVNGMLDTPTVQATNLNRSFSAETANFIESVTPGEQKNIIALGHGGIVSSYATFCSMCSQYSSHTIYPAKFSVHKRRNDTPVLSDFEIDMLREAAKTGPIIVHDEDYSSGKTLAMAVRYFVDSLGTIECYAVAPVYAKSNTTTYAPKMLTSKLTEIYHRRHGHHFEVPSSDSVCSPFMAI